MGELNVKEGKYLRIMGRDINFLLGGGGYDFWKNHNQNIQIQSFFCVVVLCRESVFVCKL
jgi:hypothetical protein